MNKKPSTKNQNDFINSLVAQIFEIQGDESVKGFLTDGSLTMKQASSRIGILREILDNLKTSK